MNGESAAQEAYAFCADIDRNLFTASNYIAHNNKLRLLYKVRSLL